MIEDSDPVEVGTTPLPPEATQEAAISADRGIVRAATVLALGNVASRVLGMARETVKATLFGTHPSLSAFEIAAIVPTTLFDLIIGGMVNSSLVPVFSEYAAQERRRELWGLVSTFLSVAIVVLLLVVATVQLFAPQIAGLLGAYNLNDPALTELSIRLTRLVAPAILFLGVSSVLTGLLYALKRFTLPAFTAAVFNATIVVVALLRPDQLDSLIWGILLGSFLQIAIQLPALRDTRLRWNLNWRHPAIRRILLLYAPIVAGLVVNQAGVTIGVYLATAAEHASLTALGLDVAVRTGDASLTYMRYATTLYQFPLGLVVTALSVATLPTLSEQANGHLEAFKRTLSQGIRLVLTLILPATAGLFALSAPIVALLFQHGQFTAPDTDLTSWVLRVFLFGLPFAAVDQMLVFASYARKDTLRPALVGVVSIVVYVVVALSLLGPFGLFSLMIADAVKHTVHASLMVGVLQRQIGGLPGQHIAVATFKSLLAALATGFTAYGVATVVAGFLPAGTLLSRFLLVAIAGGAGLALYILLAQILNIREAKSLRQLLRRR